MSPLRKLLLVCLGAATLYGVQACTSETELNPQPLPPGGEPVGAPEQAEDPARGGTTGDDKNGASPGSGAADASSEASDASDAGGG